MRTRRLAIIGMAVVIVAASLAGCKGQSSGAGATTLDSTGPTATSSAAPPASPTPADATAEFAAAAQKLRATSYTTRTIIGPSTTDAVVDPKTKSTRAHTVVSAAGQTVTVDYVVIGNDLYLKMSGLPVRGIRAGAYYHVDATRLSPDKGLRINPADPSTTAHLDSQIVNVHKTGPRSFAGTFDLTKGKSADQSQQILNTMGSAAQAVPFEATVDDQGRLATVSATLPSAGGQSLQFSADYSGFGRAYRITRPAGAREAPAQLYTVLNAG